MIINIFIVLVILLFLFLTLSYFYDKNNQGNGIIFVRIVCWMLFFIVFMAFLTSGLDYKSGTTTIQTGNETITSTETYNYSTYHNFSISLFLAIMSFFGFVTCFFELKGPGEIYVQ